MSAPSLLPPLSLYIHFPWCVKKCPYCDFNSHEAAATIPEADYVKALQRDLQHDAHYAHGRKLQSIFMGGGTPSLFSATAIEQILNEAEQTIGFADDIEITLEANPGASTEQKFRGFRQAGVNRLSLGIQSFNDRHLKTLGRIHDSQLALSAIDAARQAGFDNFNLDLMYALPEQTIGEALADIEQALALQPTHLSWYQLTVEPNTVFYNQPPLQPNEDTQYTMMEAGQQRLNNSGYQRYEISAYANHEHHSRHNLNYWQFGDYLGIGAGAHSKITEANGHIFRQHKTRLPVHYLQSLNPTVERVSIAKHELPFEFMLNALRLVDGFTVESYRAHTGLNLTDEPVKQTLDQLFAEQLLQQTGDTISPTSQGLLFLNNLVERFSP